MSVGLFRMFRVPLLRSCGRQHIGLPVLIATVFGLTGPALAAKPSAEQGRYLAEVAGCNDCHTPGYMPRNGEVPESEWLTGERFGWHGPWGTTYATNLRLTVQPFSEDAWVEYARELRARPPMPWFGLNKMTDSDLRSLYRYLIALGPAGSPAPNALPPGVEPPPPYATFPGPPPAGG